MLFLIKYRITLNIHKTGGKIMQNLLRRHHFRYILSAILAACILCSSALPTPVYAYSQPGAHTYGPGLDQNGGYLEFEDNNGWTPVKTLNGLGQADEFWLNGYFGKNDTYNGLVKLTVKVRRCSDNKIIYSGVFYPKADGTGTFNTGRIKVNSTEEKVQYFFDASTYNATPPGPYRKAYVSYIFNFI